MIYFLSEIIGVVYFDNIESGIVFSKKWLTMKNLLFFL